MSGAKLCYTTIQCCFGIKYCAPLVGDFVFSVLIESFIFRTYAIMKIHLIISQNIKITTEIIIYYYPRFLQFSSPFPSRPAHSLHPLLHLFLQLRTSSPILQNLHPSYEYKYIVLRNKLQKMI